MYKKMFKRLSVIALASTLLAACSSAPKVSYGDAAGVETTTTGFGSTDLQVIASSLVDDLLSFPPVLELTANQRPVVFVDRVKNKTSEHIDTESVTDTIQGKLLRSGRFTFVDMTAVEAVQAQFDFQKDSGLVDPSKAAAFGRQVGAKFMLYGNLAGIVKQTDRKQDVYYKFTLKLLNLESGVLEWLGEKELRKTGEKSLFGL